MKQHSCVYPYLRNHYNAYEPIFLSRLCIPDLAPDTIRGQLRKLVIEGKLVRFDVGTYYLTDSLAPTEQSGGVLSPEKVLEAKYLFRDGRRCGYIGGAMFAKQLGLTSKAPETYEVYTNRPYKQSLRTKVGPLRVIVKTPYTEINDINFMTLQFLDLLKDIYDIAEVTESELKTIVWEYMTANNISFKNLNEYLPLYPYKIYKNMYELKLLINNDLADPKPEIIRIPVYTMSQLENMLRNSRYKEQTNKEQDIKA